MSSRTQKPPGRPRGRASSRLARPKGNYFSVAGTVSSSRRAKPHSSRSPHRPSHVQGHRLLSTALTNPAVRGRGLRVVASKGGERSRVVCVVFFFSPPVRGKKKFFFFLPLHFFFFFNQNNPRRGQQGLRRACVRASESLPPFQMRLSSRLRSC